MDWIGRLYETCLELSERIWSLGWGKGVVAGGIAAILIFSLVFSRRGPWS